jgi:transcriptional regulator with XRE-family HTH domain
MLRRSDIALQFRVQMLSKTVKNIDLAERIGVSEANVSRWLKGTQNLSLDTMYLLADALDEPLSIHVGPSEPVEARQQGVDECYWSGSEWAPFENEQEENGLDNVVDLKAYANLRSSPSKDGFRPAKSEVLLWRNG